MKIICLQIDQRTGAHALHAAAGTPISSVVPLTLQGLTSSTVWYGTKKMKRKIGAQ